MAAPSGVDPPWVKRTATGAGYVVGGSQDPNKGGMPGGIPRVGVHAAEGYDLGGGLIDPETGQAYSQGQQGKYAGQKANEAWMYAGLQKLRPAPQADLTGANADLNSARHAALLGAGTLGQATAIGGQQQALADNLNQTIAGQTPSIAQLAMQRAAGEETRRNLAMASGAGGPGAIAALINAQNINATNQGKLVQDLGIQRAAEIAQARGELGNVLGTMRGQTQGEAQGYGQLGGLAGNLAQVGGGQALGQAGLQAGQNQLNQQGEQFYYGTGNDWIKNQAMLNAQRAGNWNNFFLGQGANNLQQQGLNNQTTGALIGAGGTALAALLPLLLSDIRAKTAVAPAGDAVSDVYRRLSVGNKANPSPFTSLSASSYYYKNPRAPGAAPGQQFGPMAHELEQTPAGASVVRTMPDGTKGIDTGRLALVNASETGQLRREIDDMKRTIGVKGRAPMTTAVRTAKTDDDNAKKRAKNDALGALIASGSQGIANTIRGTQVPYANPWANGSSAPALAVPPPQPMALQIPQTNYLYGP